MITEDPFVPYLKSHHIDLIFRQQLVDMRQNALQCKNSLSIWIPIHPTPNFNL